jgi:hypothetical protein
MESTTNEAERVREVERRRREEKQGEIISAVKEFFKGEHQVGNFRGTKPFYVTCNERVIAVSRISNEVQYRWYGDGYIQDGNENYPAYISWSEVSPRGVTEWVQVGLGEWKSKAQKAN